MSESKEEEMKFGGMFVPPVPGGRPMTEDQIDEYAYSWAPRGIRGWVEACTLELGRRPKRLDVVKTPLVLDHPWTESYDHIGVYTERAEGDAGTATEATYQLAVEVPMPDDAHIEIQRPPEPNAEKHMGAYLLKYWEVHNARMGRGERDLPDLPRSKVELARWKYGEATKAVWNSKDERLPLSPE